MPCNWPKGSNGSPTRISRPENDDDNDEGFDIGAKLMWLGQKWDGLRAYGSPLKSSAPCPRAHEKFIHSVEFRA